jgi:hypothetical protein
MSKHTPGPWKLYGPKKLRPQFSKIILEVQDANGLPVIPWTGFENDRTKSENRANARLIAAAPALLEALIVMVDNFGPTPSDDVRGLGEARAAIKAAKWEA